MMVKLTTAERFKDARTVHNIHGKQTLREVAAATGVTASTISDLERDSGRDVGYRNIIALANHYGVSIDWLLGLTNVRNMDASIRAVCDYTGLNEESVKKLHAESERNEEINIAQTFVNTLFSCDGADYIGFEQAAKLNAALLMAYCHCKDATPVDRLSEEDWDELRHSHGHLTQEREQLFREVMSRRRENSGQIEMPMTTAARIYRNMAEAYLSWVYGTTMLVFEDMEMSKVWGE